MTQTTPEGSPLLKAIGLTKYFGDRVGCRDITFDLWPGEVLGIVGESGSGKTTLLNLLSGQLVRTKGTVTYWMEGRDLVDLHQLPPLKNFT